MSEPLKRTRGPVTRHRWLADEGAKAFLAGLPCEAPTTREMERMSWEQGWRAAQHDDAAKQAAAAPPALPTPPPGAPYGPRRAAQADEMRRALHVIERCIHDLHGATPEYNYREATREMRRAEQQFRDARKLWRFFLDMERRER